MKIQYATYASISNFQNFKTDNFNHTPVSSNKLTYYFK